MNLTDNETIKALEDAVICVGQAPFVEKVAKGEQLKSDIIDLINRYKSENKELQHKNEELNVELVENLVGQKVLYFGEKSKPPFRDIMEHINRE